MMYQIKPNNRNSVANVFFRVFVVAVILGAIIFLNFYPSNSFTANLFLSPLKVGNYFYEMVFQVPNFFSTKEKIIEEKGKLSDEIETTRLNLVDYDIIKEENNRLYKELGLRPAAHFIGAKVVARPPQIPLDLLLLDRGSADTVKEGDWVLTSDRVLLGQIVKISRNTSMVALSSFPKVVQYGYVERTKEPIEVEGIGGGNIQAKVPIDFDIVSQDKIIVESTRAFMVASVQVVEEDQSSGFKNILMGMPVNVSKTKVVFIIPHLVE